MLWKQEKFLTMLLFIIYFYNEIKCIINCKEELCSIQPNVLCYILGFLLEEYYVKYLQKIKNICVVITYSLLNEEINTQEL